MKLRWTRRALQDLRAIGDFISRDRPGAARRWVARLQERARNAVPVPFAGRKVPELDREEDVREVFVGGYRIVYRVRPDCIEVLVVFEGHRLLPRGRLPRDLQEDR